MSGELGGHRMVTSSDLGNGLYALRASRTGVRSHWKASFFGYFFTGLRKCTNAARSPQVASSAHVRDRKVRAVVAGRLGSIHPALPARLARSVAWPWTAHRSKPTVAGNGPPIWRRAARRSKMQVLAVILQHTHDGPGKSRGAQQFLMRCSLRVSSRH